MKNIVHCLFYRQAQFKTKAHPWLANTWAPQDGVESRVFVGFICADPVWSHCPPLRGLAPNGALFQLNHQTVAQGDPPIHARGEFHIMGGDDRCEA